MTLDYQRADHPTWGLRRYRVLGGLLVAIGAGSILLAAWFLRALMSPTQGSTSLSVEDGWSGVVGLFVFLLMPIGAGVGLIVLGVAMFRRRAWARPWTAGAAWALAVSCGAWAIELAVPALAEWMRNAFSGEVPPLQVNIFLLLNPIFVGALLAATAIGSALLGRFLCAERLALSLTSVDTTLRGSRRFSVTRIGVGIWSTFGLLWCLELFIATTTDWEQPISAAANIMTGIILAMLLAMMFTRRRTLNGWIWATWVVISVAMLCTELERSRGDIDVIGTSLAVVWYLAIAWWITRLLRKEHELSVRRDLGSELC